MKLSDIELVDIGHEVVMVGACYQGNGQTFVAMFPDEELDRPPDTMPMSVEDWEALLRQSDHLDREVEVVEENGLVRKAILRKSQRQIDAHLSFRIFKRDGYACRYCGADGVPLTLDHLVLWEERGPTSEANCVTACRKDNKIRGKMQYADWLRFPYYLKVSQALTSAQRAANEALLATLDAIPRVQRQRSR